MWFVLIHRRLGKAELEEETVDVKSHGLQVDQVQHKRSGGRSPEADFGQYEGCWTILCYLQ